MGEIKRLTTAQVSKICKRCQRTILRWAADGYFSNIRKIQDGYLYMSDSTVECWTKENRSGVEVPMTLAEIAAEAGIQI